MDLSSVLATLDCGQAMSLLLSTVMIEISLEFCIFYTPITRF